MTSPFELDSYLVRRKVLKVFGASFHIYDDAGDVVGYTKQKAFKLKEDIRIFTGEDVTHPYSFGLVRFMVQHGLAGNDPEQLRIH